jgi:hypothetical protein
MALFYAHVLTEPIQPFASPQVHHIGTEKRNVILFFPMAVDQMVNPRYSCAKGKQ